MADFLYPLPKEYYDETTTDSEATKYYNRSYHGAHTYRKHGVGKLDLNCSNGTPVRSMTDGVVLRCGEDNSPTSNYHSIWVQVEGDYIGADPSDFTQPKNVKDGGILIIRYYHTSNYQFNPGDKVKQGDLLCYVGDSAVPTDTHLHIDFAYGMNANNGMPPYGLLAGGTKTEPGGYNSLSEQQKIGYQRWISDCQEYDWRGRCWEVFLMDGVWKEKSGAGGRYNGNVADFLTKAETFFREKGGTLMPWEGSQGWKSTISRYAAATISLYNELMAQGACSAAACCMLGNGYHENMVHCVINNSDQTNWGKFPAVEGGGAYDCGIWSFHEEGADAYTKKVRGMIFTDASLPTWGFTLAQVEAGNTDVQAAYIEAIMEQSDKIKTNGKSRYRISAGGNGQIINDPLTGAQISATKVLQQQYASGGYNNFFASTISVNNQSVPDLGTGTLLMERLFEKSAQYSDSLKRRVLTAWCMGYIFMGLNIV